MSFQDSAVIFFIALLLFGPRKLPELARQLGKLMGEFRRASNEFRMQMEDELRISEQAERQKQIAAIEAAAPPTAAELIPASSPAASEELAPHPHAGLSAPASANHVDAAAASEIPEHSIAAPASPEPPPPPDRYRHDEAAAGSTTPPAIAVSGDLSMMPPATGLPVGRNGSGVSAAFDSIPAMPENTVTQAAAAQPDSETATHG